MAPDSNSPSDERTAGPGSDRLGASGLKLVGERGAGSGAAAAGPSRAAESSDSKADGKAGAGVGTAPARGDAGNQGRTLPLWLFVALFVLFLIGYGYQTHQAARLEDEVARLEGSLAKAEGRLESHRTHLLEIRGGVYDLSARLEELRLLVDRDPTAAVAPLRNSDRNSDRTSAPDAEPSPKAATTSVTTESATPAQP